MKQAYKSVVLFAIVLCSTTTLFAQSIKGKVTDAATGQPLPGVSVQLLGSSKGASTATDGSYTITIGAGTHKVKASFIGYDAITTSVNVASGTSTVNFMLKEAASSLAEVAVVGSRSATARTNIQSPVPVDVISPKELKGFSQVDVGQILNFVAPSFSSNRQTVADGTDHIDPASLRGLGPDQVLVLVNGKRRHNTALVNINGTVGRGSVGTDMNVIPVAAIERIEVLRDGAAAQYGSDAIAGVINIVLKKGFEGTTVSMNLGQNMTTMKYSAPQAAGGSKEYSKNITDGQVFQFDISKGFRLGKDGQMTVSGQYNARQRTDRSGLDNAPTIYLGAAGGFPGTPTGQDPTVFRKGLIAADAAIAATRGYNRQNMVFGNSDAKNLGLFVNGSVPTNSKSEFYFSGGITHRTGSGFGNNRVPVNRSQQPLNVDGSIYYPDGFLPAIESTIGDKSLVLGYKTKCNSWNIDLSNSFGMNTFQFGVSNSGNSSLPNSNTPQTSFDAGTLRFNQNTTNLDFSRRYEKAGAVSGLNVAFGAEFRRDQYQISAGEFNSYYGNGRVVPAAPLTDGGVANGTAVALPGSQVFPGFQPTDEVNKSRTNLGFYGDLEGELGRLLLGTAVRYENYSDFGSNVSGKVSGRFKLAENIALRGSASTGFRAPSLHQRYFQNTSTQFVSGNPSNTLTVNNDNPIARTVIGVDALRPETSVNFTLGLTAKAGNTSFTIDAYQIDIKDRIVYSGAFSRALLGFGANDYLGVNNVNFFANAANTRTRGVDMVVSGKYPLGKGKLTLTAALNLNENKVTGINSTSLIDNPAKNGTINADGTYSSNPGAWFRNLLFDRQQISRIEVWQPKDKLNVSASYSIGKFDFTVRAVRFGEVKYVHNVYTEAKNSAGAYFNTSNNIAGVAQNLFLYNSDGTAMIDQTFAPVIITDLVVNYKLTKTASISLGANNLFDVYPDQIFIDPRNAYGTIDYNSGRDASNRGRLLFQPNQGGYNGRHVFTRLVYSF